MQSPRGGKISALSQKNEGSLHHGLWWLQVFSEAYNTSPNLFPLWTWDLGGDRVVLRHSHAIHPLLLPELLGVGMAKQESKIEL